MVFPFKSGISMSFFFKSSLIATPILDLLEIYIVKFTAEHLPCFFCKAAGSKEQNRQLFHLALNVSSAQVSITAGFLVFCTAIVFNRAYRRRNRNYEFKVSLFLSFNLLDNFNAVLPEVSN